MSFGAYLPDLQSEPPKVAVRVDRVGLVKVRVPSTGIHVGDTLYLVQRPVFTVYVDLPQSQRGIHASRSYESIYRAASEAVASGKRLEDICADVARDLLARHNYATSSSCILHGELFRVSKSPSSSAEAYDPLRVWAYASAERMGEVVRVRRGVGVTVNGVTACPCAQSVVKKLIEMERGSSVENGDVVGTHMQRTVASVRLFFTDGETANLLELADILRGCMSAPTYEVLKRIDEGQVVLRALSNPLFVEDVAREAAARIAERYGYLSPETRLAIRVKSIESVHSYDLEARLTATLGEIKAGL